MKYVFVAVAFLQLSLLGEGAFSDSDELTYHESINSFYYLMKGEYKEFLFHLTSLSKYAGKPIIQLIPVSIQVV